MRDTPALWMARALLRTCQAQIRQINTKDPTIRCTITELDEMCVGITTEIESEEPRLALVGGGR